MAEASPGLLAVSVKPLPGVEIPRLGKVAIPCDWRHRRGAAQSPSGADSERDRVLRADDAIAIAVDDTDRRCGIDGRTSHRA